MVPGLGQYLPLLQEMNGAWPRTVSTPPTGDEWVHGLGQYLPLLQEMNGTRPRTVSTPPTGDEWCLA